MTSTLMYSLYQEKTRAEFLLALTELRITLQNAIIKPQNWMEIVANHPNMSCFAGAAPSSCTALQGMAPQDLKLYSLGALFYDSTSPTAGYTLEGLPCNSYGPGSICVLKPRVRWQAQCNLPVDPTCTSPLILINLSFDYAGDRFRSINFASYGFRVSKATFPLQTAGACPTAVPACTASQAAICEPAGWVCREFGP